MKWFNHKNTLFIVLMPLLLVACSHDKNLCTNKKVLNILTDKLNTELIEGINELVEKSKADKKIPNDIDIDQSSINKLTKNHFFSLNNILTVDKSEKTLKQICKAELNTTIPENILKIVNDSFSLLKEIEQFEGNHNKENSIENLDDFEVFINEELIKELRGKIRTSADKKFSYLEKIIYEVQPYDDNSSYNVSYKPFVSPALVSYINFVAAMYEPMKKYIVDEKKKAAAKK